MQEEIWATCPRSPRYEISSFGFVRWSSNKRNIKPWKCPGKAKTYLKVNLWIGGKKETHFVHKLVLETFSGDRPTGSFALHLNDVSDDNRRENLRWGSQSDNEKMKDPNPMCECDHHLDAHDPDCEEQCTVPDCHCGGFKRKK